MMRRVTWMLLACLVTVGCGDDDGGTNNNTNQNNAGDCGNGLVEGNEACDSGESNADDPNAACRTDCQLRRCGDDIVDDDFQEACDDGAANSDDTPDACRTDCSAPGCGDGVVDTGEVCDGSNFAGDSCTARGFSSGVLTCIAACQQISDAGCSGIAPAAFDHFTLVVTPATPLTATNFQLTVTAYSSSDEATVMTPYNGTVSVSVSASSIELTGDATAQPITAGTATLTLQIDTPATDLVLVVTDDDHPTITGSSAPFTVLPEGDTATLRGVVISEVNWYGNTDVSDEWIEIRNISGGPLNLSGWIIEGADTGDQAVMLDANTVLADGAYLVIGQLQGPDVDGQRTSLTGVAGVQLQGLSLANGGEQLVLRDVAGNLIDATPSAGWPEGSSATLRSMERNDDVSGSGYTDGTLAGSWHTWRAAPGVDTTHADTTDHGTPGAHNTPPPVLLHASSFEAADPNFELFAGATTFSNTPPAGTSARTGAQVITVGSISTAYTGRSIQSISCIALLGDQDPILASIWAMASTGNGGNTLRSRIKILWYTDATCATAHTTADTAGPGQVLTQGTYLEVGFNELPPSGATHYKIRFEVADDNGAPNTGDDWAADDVWVRQ